MAKSFDGTNSHSSAGDVTFLDGLTKFSWACWVNPTGTADAADHFVWVKSNPWTDGMYVYRDDSGPSGTDVWECYYRVGSGTAIRISSNVSNANSNGWAHLGGWFENGSSTGLALLKNGAHVSKSPASASGSPGAYPNISNPLRIGQNDDGTGRFKGDIGYLCFWNTRLVVADFSALAKGASPLLIQPGNIIYYTENRVAGDNTPRILTGSNGTWTDTSVTTAEQKPVVIGGPWTVNAAPAAVGGATVGVGLTHSLKLGRLKLVS